MGHDLLDRGGRHGHRRVGRKRYLLRKIEGILLIAMACQISLHLPEITYFRLPHFLLVCQTLDFSGQFAQRRVECLIDGIGQALVCMNRSAQKPVVRDEFG
jgi:hypothetical protein